MGHDHLRKDKTCENCGHTVELTYCPNCGQKNVETRQSFGHLVTHFIEDFTHYDGAFWKTIKYLLFYPGRLTTEYLAGRRQKFVPPVKLYIFISFVTFFLAIALLDSPTEEKREYINEQMVKEHVAEEEPYFPTVENVRVTSVAMLDSLQHSLPEEKRLNYFSYWIKKKEISKNRKFGSINTDEEGFLEQLVHTFPKLLFFYLPIFAFILWLFHNKKRWYFFDHGIFALHFFSFMLLLLMFINIISTISDNVLGPKGQAMLLIIVYPLLFIWSTYYLFRSHYKVYPESTAISVIKSFFITIINLALFAFLLALLSSYISLVY